MLYKKIKVTSPGFDDIDVKIIKECCTEISPTLIFIINKLFAEGYFPKQLQIAKVIPIFKKGEKCNYNNYRPVSILPSIIKIFEKLFTTRLIDYFTNFSLLTDCQYGFRPNYSTELAIQHLCQSIHNTLDAKNNQITVFCDLSKAFDTISHHILLHKLSIYGIRGKAYNFLRSYLFSRTQFTVYNNNPSSYNPVRCGVPQGSILGPILFLIYVNDIIHTSNKLNFLLFADDTTIYVQGHSINEITEILNKELINVSHWIKANKLTLNVTKTFYMVSSFIKSVQDNIDIKLNNKSLNRVNTKFLGVAIDGNLTKKAHLQQLCIKISQINGVIYRIRNNVTKDSLKLIY